MQSQIITLEPQRGAEKQRNAEEKQKLLENDWDGSNIVTVIHFFLFRGPLRSSAPLRPLWLKVKTGYLALVQAIGQGQ
jgi:hypothetical protein